MCSLDVAFMFATVRNRPREDRMAFLEVSDAALLGFAWQAWHFATFRRVL